MKKLSFLTVGMGALIALLETEAYAGRLNIINKNKKDLQIVIQPEETTSNGKRIEYIRIIPAQHQITFDVTEEELEGKTTFNIKGKVNKFTPGSTCDHLSSEENYRINFTDDLVGTTCKAEKMK